jgi:hypothetical protein
LYSFYVFIEMGDKEGAQDVQKGMNNDNHRNFNYRRAFFADQPRSDSPSSQP